MLKPAAAGGLLCFGPDRERNVTFTDPHSWLPDIRWDELDPDAALREIVSRFLDTYGPATHEDFGRWWGTDAASARKIFAAHTDVMISVEVDGRKAWLPAGDASTTRGDASGVLLLPGFDPTSSHRSAPVRTRFLTGSSTGCRAPPAGSHRCWSSTAWSAASGPTSGPATRSGSRSRPLARSHQRRRSRLPNMRSRMATSSTRRSR